MAVWQIIKEGDNAGTIIKDGVAHFDLNISWLPSDIHAVQGKSDGSAFIEKTNTEMDFVSDLSEESWFSNISTTWQAAEDAVENTEE